MLSSVSRSMHMAFFLIDMTERPTSMQPWSFPFFSCVERNTLLSICLHVCECRTVTDRWRCWCNTHIWSTLCILQDAFFQHKVSLNGKKNQTQSRELIFFHLLTHLNHRFTALFGYTTAKHISKKKGMQTFAPLSLDPAIHDDHV